MCCWKHITTDASGAICKKLNMDDNIENNTWARGDMKFIIELNTRR